MYGKTVSFWDKTSPLLNGCISKGYEIFLKIALSLRPLEVIAGKRENTFKEIFKFFGAYTSGHVNVELLWHIYIGHFDPKCMIRFLN